MDKQENSYNFVNQKPLCKVVTIEVIQDLSYSDNDVIKSAIEELQSIGYAEIISSYYIMNSYNEAIKILAKRKIKDE